MADQSALHVLVWDENPPHAPKEVYPDSINGAVAHGLEEFGGSKLEVRSSSLDDPEQGVSEQDAAWADVLLWWGHSRHGAVSDETAGRVARHVHERGLGLVALHSAHYSKAFRFTLQCEGHLKGGWRDSRPPETRAPDSEELNVCAPWHPIAKGVADFTLDKEEMYGAPFDVPPPSCLVLQSYFPYGGECFPSGICWTVGTGKTPGFTSGNGGGVGEGEGIGRVFYFRPGHETYPTYFNPMVRQVIYNGVLWCGKRI